MSRVGIRDVAVRAGVSISTVSNALNKPGSVSSVLTERIRAAVDELGYVPLHAAQQLRVRRSGLLGMTVINIANPYFGSLVTGFEDAAAAGGMRVLVGNANDDAQRERDHLELFESVQVEGALVAPFGDNARTLSRLRSRGIPIVLVDSVDDAGIISSVSFDNIAGGRLAAEHLISLGRRRLVFLGAREEVRQVRERLQGVRDAVSASDGVDLEVVWTARTTPELGRSWSEQFAQLPPDARPDGVIATNDLLACGVVSGLVQAGVRVPDDLAVVGYDDIAFARVAAVPLTSIRQPAQGMGRRAGELLLEQVGGERERKTVVYEPELVVRASTGGQQ
jgi:LacI family transcriptional regulator